jgi:hypothetical protein
MSPPRVARTRRLVQTVRAPQPHFRRLDMSCVTVSSSRAGPSASKFATRVVSDLARMRAAVGVIEWESGPISAATSILPAVSQRSRRGEMRFFPEGGSRST